jgi:hypothetical protein
MFGKPPSAGNGNAPTRPAASDVAKIQGGGLVQVIVTSLSPMTFFLFVNDKEISAMEVDNLSVEIHVPEEGEGNPTVRAGLSRYIKSVTGEQTTQYTDLFPSTVEIVALGRRILITAQNADSLENLWISLGLRADGTASDLSGLKALRIVLTNSLLDAKLTWEDGETEDLLPH